MKEFAHLKLLRRFLLSRERGRLIFRDGEGDVELLLEEGRFLHPEEEPPVAALARVLSMTHCDTITEVIGAPSQPELHRTHPVDLMLRSCYSNRFSYLAAHRLSRFFYMFPPVRIRLAPLHRKRAIFPGYPRYVSLHKRASLNGQVSLKDTLTGLPSDEHMVETVRLLTFLYMTGLMAPAPHHEEKSNVVGRLMKRIRGL